MKKNLFKGIAVAAAAIAMISSCQIEEEMKTKTDAFIVTATIDNGGTRVEYTVDNDANKISQKWETGDQIIGFDDNGASFSFTVSAVDENGRATFNVGSYDPAGATTLYAVFCPGKSVSDFVDNTLDIDLTSQTGSLENDPAVPMCATGTVTDNSVSFTFENQAAIIGVKKFKVGASESVSSFTVTGLAAKGQFKVDGGKLVLVPSTTVDDITVSFSPALTADASGVVATPTYFVALPTPEAFIGVSAECAEQYNAIVNKQTIEAGKYYYTSKILSDAVACFTNNGGSSWTYVGSLAAAISGISTDGTKDQHMVVLFKDDAIGANALPDLSGKKFTLDGNGKTYNVSGRTAAFESNTSTDITFENIVFDGGSIVNTARFLHVVGNVTFGAGTEFKNIKFKQTNTAAVVAGIVTVDGSSAVLNINGSYIHDCATTSDGNGSGGFIANLNGGSLFMTSGTVENLSVAGNTTPRGAFAFNYDTGCKINITGGTFTGCTSADAGGWIYSLAGTVNVSNAKVLNCEGKRAGAAFFYSTTATIMDSDFDGCKATGGSASPGNGGAFVCSTDSNVTISDGSTIKNCSAYNGGAVACLGGTITLDGTSVSQCTNSNSGGSFYLTGGTLNVKNSTVTRGNAYIANAGTLNIDNSTFNYTVSSTGNALYLTGKSSANAGKINISNGSLIKSVGRVLYATYGTVTCNDSDFVGNSSDGAVYFAAGASLEFRNSRGVNTNTTSTAAVFYSNTTITANTNCSVRSGYYSANYIAARSASLSSDYFCRIWIYDGCYSRTNKVTNTAGYNGVTKTFQWYSLNPSVTQTIDGITYTFPYVVGSSAPQDNIASSFHNPEIVNL